MSKTNKRKDGSYASLTGFQRAMPIILFALAIFIALCFFTQNTGALGSAIGEVLLGCFSIGGYFIPLFLAIHAFFYSSDYQKGAILPRVIFSVIFLIFISALSHAIENFGTNPVFDAAKFYNDGIESVGGGFVGGLVSFVIMKMVGPVGLIILAVTIFALYITYSLIGKTTFFKRFLKKLGLKFLKSAAKAEQNMQERSKQRKAKKAEAKLKAKKAQLEKQSKLLEDDFFDESDATKNLRIDELGVKTKKDETELINASPSRASASANEKLTRKERKAKKKRAFSSDYGVSEEDGFSKSTIDQQPSQYNPFADSDDPAKVFTDDFLPFDVEANEKLAAKQSSLAARNAMKDSEEEIREQPRRKVFSADQITAARRRAEFEFNKSVIKKQREIEAQRNAENNNANDIEHTELKNDEPVQNAPLVPPVIDIDIPFEEVYEPQYSAPVREENLEEKYRRAGGYASVINNAPDEEAAKRSEREKELSEQKAREAAAAAQRAREAELQEKARLQKEREAQLAREKELEARLANERAIHELRMKEAEDARIAAEKLAKEREIAMAEAAAKNNDPIARIFEEELAKSPSETTTFTFGSDSPDSASSSGDGTSLEFTTDNETKTQVFNFDIPFESDDMSKKEEELSPSPKPVYAEHPKEASPETSVEPIPAPEQSHTLSNALPDVFDIPVPENAPPAFEPKNPYEDTPEEESDEIIYGEQPIPESEQNPEINEYRKRFAIFNDDAQDNNGSIVDKAPSSIPALSDYSGADSESKENTYSGMDSYSSISISDNILDDLVEEDDEMADNPESDDEFYEDSFIAPPFPDSSEENDLPPFDFDSQEEEESEPQIPTKEKPDYSAYQHPPIDLLAKGMDEDDPEIEAEIAETGEKLIDALEQFNVKVSIKSVDRGPRITRYEIVPARGVRVNNVMNLEDDIALKCAAEGIRMEAPIPGKAAIGVEVPNKHSVTVFLRDLLESEEFRNSGSKTFCCVGKDVTGNPVFGDIAKMPHVLVAGATGMGKSVCINSILISILYRARPDEVKFIMVDPKMVEFTLYNGIPHLLIPVVTDVNQAAGALMWAVDEMNRRYELMAKYEVRQLDSYNEMVKENPEMGEPLPKIVIVIDELNDLMQRVRKPVEDLITNITQKARAAGIHMIIGTQRPSVDVITGVIKANIPSRISCKVTSFNDSKTILDQAGAEKLLDKGDMLFAPVGKPKPIRVQGAFVSEGEVGKIMKFLKSNIKGSIYDEQALEEINRAAQKCVKGKDSDGAGDSIDGEEGAGYMNDSQFLEAVDVAIKARKISTSLLQRKISIGYSKAAKFLDIMEDLGLVSESKGSKPRDVLVTSDEWQEIRYRRSSDD